MKKKRLLIYLFLGIDLLAISGISVSIAWFPASSNLRIDMIDISVDCDPDILISTDAQYEHAKQTLKPEDFCSTPEEVKNLKAFEPVTTMTAEHSDWILDKTVTQPVFLEQYKTTNVEKPVAAIANHGYFSKQFYLFSNQAMYVTFDSENSKVVANQNKNAAVAQAKASASGGNYDDILEDLNSIQDSVRIALLDRDNETNEDFTIIDPNKQGETQFGGRLNLSSVDHYYDFYTDHANNVVNEIVFGDIKNQDHPIKYLPAQGQDSPTPTRPTCFNAVTRAGVRAVDLDDLSTNVEFYKEQSITMAEADVSKTDDMSHGYLIKLEPMVAHPVTISVYIEGWDLDNTDYTQEGSFDMSVKFKLYRKAGF